MLGRENKFSAGVGSLAERMATYMQTVKLVSNLTVYSLSQPISRLVGRSSISRSVSRSLIDKLSSYVIIRIASYI